MFIRIVVVGALIGAVGCDQSRRPGSDSLVVALAELNTTSLAALDPTSTAFILNSAPLEEHGPHLPIAADSYQGAYSAREMARQMADALPGWKIVLLPTLWLTGYSNGNGLQTAPCRGPSTS